MLSDVIEPQAEVGPSTAVHRLMMSAAARALDDGRTEIGVEDLLLALSRDRDTGPLLAELGADERALRDAVGEGG
jgi:hypothetical protein